MRLSTEVLPDAQVVQASMSDETYYFVFLAMFIGYEIRFSRCTSSVALRGGSPPMLLDHCGANVEAKEILFPMWPCALVMKFVFRDARYA